MSINLNEDEISQIAFETGQPADNGDGYTFTQEEWEEFMRALFHADKGDIY